MVRSPVAPALAPTLKPGDVVILDDVSRAIGAAIDIFTPAERANYFAAAG